MKQTRNIITGLLLSILSAVGVAGEPAAMQFGIPLNDSFDYLIKTNQSNDLNHLGFFLSKLVKKGPDYSKPLYKQVKAAHGHLLVFSDKKILGGVVKTAPQQNENVREFTQLVSTLKTSPVLKSAEKNQQTLKAGFQQVASANGIGLTEVAPGQLMKQFSHSTLNNQMIAAVLDHAITNPGTVYMMAFHGQKYQFFTLSVQDGKLKLGFAATHDQPVVTAVASMTGSEIDYDNISAAIDEFQNHGYEKERDKVPHLIGIWTLFNK